MRSGPLIGFHVSIAGSIDLAVDRAVEMGCTTFQIFTRNPRGWAFKPLEDTEVARFKAKRERAGFETVVAHMPYLPNLAASIPEFQKKSRESLKVEVARCGQLEVDYLIAHIGSHMGKGTMVGVKNVVGACNEALEASHGKTVLAIETMAGQSNSVGSRFEELRLILDGVKESKRIGVCVDTCHIFASGFDITTKAGVGKTMEMFEDVVGKDRLKVVHLNDSVGPMGGGLDRHEYVGKGQIGENGFRALLHHESVSKRPIIMEVPVDDKAQYEESLRLARRLASR